MTTLEIVPTDSKLTDLIANFKKTAQSEKYPNTLQSLDAVGEAIQTGWQMKVGSKGKIERKAQGLSQTIFSTDKMVHWLEFGLPSYDMKDTHTKGAKSRTIKSRVNSKGETVTSWYAKRGNTRYKVHAGDRYLIIPFSHQTGDKAPAGSPPNFASIYRKYYKGFQATEVTGSREEVQKNKDAPNFGKMVKRATYSYGDKVQNPTLPKNLQGIVRMKQDTDGAKRSGWVSFRVLSQNSPADAWIHPGIQKQQHLKKMLDKNKMKIEEIVLDGMKKDLGS